MAHVLIADDHAVARAGSRQFLEADPRVELIGEVSSGNAILSALRRERWDLLLLDLHMPGRGGLDTLSHAVNISPQTRVLTVSELSEQAYARSALSAGACGFISKNAPSDEIRNAIKTVLSGRRYISDAVAQLLVGHLGRSATAAPHSTLSSRELQVLRKLGGGSTVRAIGTELNLSPKTITTYRQRLLEKLQLTTNAELAAYAFRHELIH